MKLELLVLDDNFKEISIIDSFASCIWTDRLNEYGDFEIYTNMDVTLFNLCKKDYYLWTENSEHQMIIEQKLIKTDVEDGSKLIISGRSLETILYRRIVWGQKILSGNFQDSISVLLTENIINPTDPNRKISNFIFEPSTDPLITELVVEAQYFGEYLYDVINRLCVSVGIGFKIILNSQNQFVFSLYAGKDRTYNQAINPYVIFSPEFENLLDSEYSETNKTYKNVAMIAGEGEGSDRTIINIGTGNGLSRKEYFCDASDLSKTTDTGILTDTQYQEQLSQRGLEELTELQETITFEGEVDATKTFIYGQDFYLGDIVQIENEYGITGTAYISEFIISQDNNGISMYPTFNMIEE